MLTDLKMSIARNGDTAEVVLGGRLDVLAAPELRSSLNEQLDGGVTSFELYFAEVGFIDSAGIAAVVSLVTKAKRAGGSVRIHGPVSSVVHRIFDLTGFATVFDTVDWRVVED